MLAIAAFGILSATGATVRTTDNRQGCEKWVRNMFVKSRQLPFSFRLDGVASDDFAGGWQRRLEKRASDSADENRYEFTLTDPRHTLEVKADITTYNDFAAAEWVLHFTNMSDSRSPQISDISVADLTIASDAPDSRLYTACGISSTDRDFHLESYSPADTTLYFRPSEGRSSSITAFPFYNLAFGDRNGMCIAIGWSGTWEAAFTGNDRGEVRFETGMADTDLYLNPGETIRTPRVALIRWEGANRIDGNNLLRRFMLAHHSPKLPSGQNITPPLCAGFDWGDPAPCSEYEALTELLARAVVERHRNFGLVPEVFWLDAGWSDGNNAPRSAVEGRGWYTTVGSWTTDSTRFPRGLRPVADDIHALGAKFMVWFEPERVFEGSRIFREHPEWLLTDTLNRHNRLLDLGNPDAFDYICRTIGDFMEQNGIDYYRQDFNLVAAPFWAQADPPGRKGISEIRHIENLYRFWDYLRERFPGMLIDNCASGGRRIDLETCSRSIPLWRTDCHYGEPTCQQSHEYGLSQFLPSHGTGVYVTDPYCYRSGMSSAFLWGGEIFTRKNSYSGMKDIFALHRELRPYYLCDFYPLSGDGSTLGHDRWIAWQFHNRADGSGIIQAFRRENAPEPTYRVVPAAIDPEATYDLTDYDRPGETVSITGRELAEGLTLTADTSRRSLLLRYTPRL